jgi:hypothetical protein
MKPEPGADILRLFSRSLYTGVMNAKHCCIYNGSDTKRDLTGASNQNSVAYPITAMCSVGPVSDL